MANKPVVTIEVKTVPLTSVTLNPDNIYYKSCTRCKQIKPLSEFGKCIRNKDGLKYYCRKCSSEIDKKTRLANPEKKRKTDRLYREKNIDRIREYDRNRVRDPQKRKEVYTKWLANHKDRSAEIKRNWEKRNPDKVMDNSRLKRARRRNAIIEKFPAFEIYERDQWICQLCHKRVNKNLRWPDPMSPSIDHITPISQGGAHERRNVQLTHVGCNMKAGVGGIKQMRLI